MTDEQKDALVKVLHDLIMDAAPRSETRPKYGGVLYTLRPEEKEGQFCGVFVYKAHVQLSFAHGAALDDPTGVLSGSGKFRRHVSFTTTEDVKPQVLSRLLEQAASEGAK